MKITPRMRFSRKVQKPRRMAAAEKLMPFTSSTRIAGASNARERWLAEQLSSKGERPS